MCVSTMNYVVLHGTEQPHTDLANCITFIEFLFDEKFNKLPYFCI